MLVDNWDFDNFKIDVNWVNIDQYNNQNKKGFLFSNMQYNIVAIKINLPAFKWDADNDAPHARDLKV